ncbi:MULTISPECIES: hypothetical protein [unclassified Microbacterium]|uniref:hypothetical protein n=1 Tax=unclassified Microbacterium TaxID=2609290 RepID=UPI0030167F5B
MKPARLIVLVVAVGMVPFALASYNGATLLGVAAITAFIALTIVGAPSKKDHRP